MSTPETTETQKPASFVIIGAGLAGIATAIGLRAQGHSVQVYERHAAVQEIGAAVECGPNGTRILNHLGLNFDNLNAVKCTGVNEFNFRGASLVQRDFNTDEVDGWPVLLIHRKDLLAELLRIAEDPNLPGKPVEIFSRSKVASLNCDTGFIELQGGHRIMADVVIAADGTHSTARSAVIGYDSMACFSGEATYRALVPTEAAFQNSEIAANIDLNRFTMFIARDCRVIIFPCSSGQVLNVMSIVPDETEDAIGVSDSWAEAWEVQDMVDDFESFPEYIQKLLSLATQCGRWKLYDHAPLPTWVKGRALVIGDAAHPMLPTQGQGLCQSLEDAEATSTILGGLESGSASAVVTKKLETVMKCRFERATRIQALSRSQARGPRRAGQAQDSHDFSWYNWSTISSMDWLKRIEKRSEQLDLPSIVPSKVTQMMPDTDLIAPGGRGDGDEAKTEPSDYTAQKTNDQSSFGNQWEEKQQTAEPAKRGCACQCMVS